MSLPWDSNWESKYSALLALARAQTIPGRRGRHRCAPGMRKKLLTGSGQIDENLANEYLSAEPPAARPQNTVGGHRCKRVGAVALLTACAILAVAVYTLNQRELAENITPHAVIFRNKCSVEKWVERRRCLSKRVWSRTGAVLHVQCFTFSE